MTINGSVFCRKMDCIGMAEMMCSVVFDKASHKGRVCAARGLIAEARPPDIMDFAAGVTQW